MLGGRKTPCVNPDIELINRQWKNKMRIIRILHLKPNEKDSTNRKQFYTVVIEKEDLVHIKINILGSNLKQVLWMR
jgi:hypothetical protein